MKEMSDVLFEAMLESVKKMIKERCQEILDNSKYLIKKIYENNDLVGFCVCHDDGDFRVLDECHYLGKDKYACLRMWKFMTSGKKKLRIICQKVNEKMADYYKNGLKFNIVSEDSITYVFERVR